MIFQLLVQILSMKKRIQQLLTTTTNTSSLSNNNQQEEQKKLQNKIEDLEKSIIRLKEVFYSKITDFREACYLLTGYKITVKNNMFRLRSMYAEREEDDLIFTKLKTTNGEKAKFQVMETTLCKTLDIDTLAALSKLHSIPLFLSHITMELFEKQTRFT